MSKPPYIQIWPNVDQISRHKRGQHIWGMQWSAGPERGSRWPQRTWLCSRSSSSSPHTALSLSASYRSLISLSSSPIFLTCSSRASSSLRLEPWRTKEKRRWRKTLDTALRAHGILGVRAGYGVAGRYGAAGRSGAALGRRMLSDLI